VIVVDDLGYADLGVMGSTEIKTPNIDRLASTGVRFTNGYANSPICAPSRAALLTGRYPQRYRYAGMTRFLPEEKRGLRTAEVLLAEVLKQAGYATGAIGKWHLGVRPEYHPLSRGFDEYFGFLEGAHRHNRWNSPNAPFHRGREEIAGHEYLTHAFTREATEFIERHRDERFFLYLAYDAVHFPFQVPARYENLFRHVEDKQRRRALGMITALDEGIGQVLGKLREAKLEKDTLIFFLSDNGGGVHSDNGPLRGGKNSLYEGGIRVPFFVRWPARLTPAEYDEVVSAIDVFPTAVAAAGAAAAPDLALDGVDLLPYLTGERAGLPHAVHFWALRNRLAVRQGTKKLLFSADETLLYDLAGDPGETHDLAAADAELVKELRTAALRWQAQMPEPLPLVPSAQQERRRAERQQ